MIIRPEPEIKFSVRLIKQPNLTFRIVLFDWSTMEEFAFIRVFMLYTEARLAFGAIVSNVIDSGHWLMISHTNEASLDCTCTFKISSKFTTDLYERVAK
jgi:hypothetical protein